MKTRIISDGYFVLYLIFYYRKLRYRRIYFRHEYRQVINIVDENADHSCAVGSSQDKIIKHSKMGRIVNGFGNLCSTLFGLFYIFATVKILHRRRTRHDEITPQNMIVPVHWYRLLGIVRCDSQYLYINIFFMNRLHNISSPVVFIF